MIRYEKYHKESDKAFDGNTQIIPKHKIQQSKPIKATMFYHLIDFILAFDFNVRRMILKQSYKIQSVVPIILSFLYHQKISASFDLNIH